MVLKLNQEIHAPRLHVHGADRTRHHPTSRSSGHRVPNMCDHPRSSTLGLQLLPWSSSLSVMPHLPRAHHEISKRDSPHDTKIKVKTEMSRIQIQTLPSQWFITIKSRNWPLGFSISPLMSSLTTKRTKVESKTPWSTARIPERSRKAQEDHLEEGKAARPIKDTKKRQTKEMSKEKLKTKTNRARKAQTQNSPWNQLPLTLSMQALPLR
jgi:hypothetical protein